MENKGFFKSEAHQQFGDIEKELNNLEIAYAYYIIALNTACIGFGFVQSIAIKLNFNSAVLLTAISFWFISVINGCLLIRSFISLVRFERDKLGDMLTNRNKPEEYYTDVYENLTKKFLSKNKWMYLCMVLGIVAYIIWHILKMINN